MLQTEPDAALLDSLEQQLAGFFTRERERAEHRGPLFGSLWHELDRLAVGGKRVRPLLLLHTHRLLGGTDEASALRAGLALELLHTAFLIHDDVLDRDLERRGRPNITGHFATVARQAGRPEVQAIAWGEANALLAGDLLLTAALREIALLPVDADTRSRVLDAFDAGIAAAAAGEQADIAFGLGLHRPDLDSITRMMRQKTASYSFQAPLQIAAILAGAPALHTEVLREIGRALGLVFQMRDDLLGVFGDPTVTGKSTVGDLREGKHTMLIAHADGSPHWERVSAAWGDPDLDESGAAILRRALERSGARRAVEDLIDAEAGRAARLIAESTLPGPLARMLQQEVTRGSERSA